MLQSLLYGRNVDRARKTKARLGLAMVGFAVVYAVIAARLVLYAVAPETRAARHGGTTDAVATARPDLLDRNGEILATDLKTPSLFAEPRRIIDPDEALELLTAVMPDLDTAEMRDRLGSRRGFAWLQARDHAAPAAGGASPRHSRHRLPDREQARLSQRQRGLAPHRPRQRRQSGHRRHGEMGRQPRPRRSPPRRIRHRPRAEADRARRRPARPARHARRAAWRAREKFKAKAAAGLILDVRTGEIVSMVSVPDYNPNNPREALDPNRINRLTTGVYEMGSTFKALTMAMALDTGKMTLNSSFDARGSLRYGHFNISDYHAQNRVLTVPEIFTYSSNVGAARMALVGRRRGAQGVPAQGRPARPAAHRAAGERRADRSQALGRTQHRHHRVRPRPLGGAAAVGDGRRRARQRRLSHSADLPQAQREPTRWRSPSAWSSRRPAPRCAI